MKQNEQPKSPWPELVYENYKGTVETVHLWTQIVGKIRLKQWPWLNHSWHVTLYVTARGFGTGSIPYEEGAFELEFDFISHQLHISTSTGLQADIKLYARSVADFYNELFIQLNNLGVEVEIIAIPNEMEQAVPFAEDIEMRNYQPEQMYQVWQALVKVNNLFNDFRARFTGKCSPVHFFWGAFDLAVTRFSGRRAPVHPGGAPNMPLRVMQEAYSHEVSSCGFWPGSPAYPQAAFYAYCYPTPDAFKDQPVRPEQAYFNSDMGEFILNYTQMTEAGNPESALMQFLQSTYEAAANTANWDRAALECDLRSFES